MEARLVHLQANVIDDLVVFNSSFLDFLNTLLFVVMLLLQTLRLSNLELPLAVAHQIANIFSKVNIVPQPLFLLVPYVHIKQFELQNIVLEHLFGKGLANNNHVVA